MSSERGYDVDEAIQAAVELRALIREAHGAIKDLRQELKAARGEIAGDLARAPKEVGDLIAGIGDICNQALGDWLVRLSEKCPLTMMCPGCGMILAVLTAEGETCQCSSCGRRFRTRSAQAPNPA